VIQVEQCAPQSWRQRVSPLADGDKNRLFLTCTDTPDTVNCGDERVEFDQYLYVYHAYFSLRPDYCIFLSMNESGLMAGARPMRRFAPTIEGRSKGV